MSLSTIVSPRDVLQIEQACDRFEAAWKAGQRPRLEDFLGASGQTLNGALARHLIELDWEYRLEAGEKPQAAEYVARFPAASSIVEGVRRELTANKSPGGSHPRQLGKYRILRQVGRGGMGIVYEAVHEPTDRRVAIKLMPGVDLALPTARERFWREAQTTARLNHPNIVQIIEVGEDDGHLFLALEFVDGPSLSDCLRKAPQPPRPAAALVETLARAVQHAHEQGIVHRDLKPANVLLACGGKATFAAHDQDTLPAWRVSDYTPKITDFGLAHPVEGSDLTVTGDIIGTPGYMAPEQAWGKSKERSVGPAADVYALGAVLYATLTGRPPFHGVSVLDALEQARSQDPVPPTRLQPAVPRDLETICLKCLEKEPRQRYQTAAELANDLSRYLAGQPIKARRTGRLQRARRWCRRNPAAAAASGLGVVAVLAAAGLAVNHAITVQLRTEQEHTKAALYEAQVQRGLASQTAEQLAEQQMLTKAALVRAEDFRGQAERLSVNLGLERGLALLDQKEIARGMLVLARSLEIAPAEAHDLQHVIRSNLAAAHRQLPFHLQSVSEHGGEVHGLAFSPDGKVLLTAGRLSGARRFDAATGEPLGKPLPHEAEIRAVAFSADGRILATAGTDKAARLWDAETGRPIGKPLLHAHWVQAVAISPDARTVFTGSADGTARLWDLQTGEQLGDLRPPGWVYAVAYSPDGKTLVTGSGSRAQLWNAETLEPIGEPMRHQSEVWTVAFRPDGRVLLTGSEEGTARLWEADSGQPRGLPLVHQAAVRSAGYSQDGTTIWTAGVDGKVRLWDAEKGKPIGAAVLHQSAVYAAALSPDGRRLATGSSGGKVRLFEEPVPVKADVVLDHKRLAYCMAISPDGQTIATGTADATVRMWNAATGEPLNITFKHPSSVLRLAFSPDGRTLLTACTDNTARLWNVEDGTPLDVVLPHANHVYAVAFSPDGRLIATGSKDSTACLWDAATGKQLCGPWKHGGWVHTVAFSPDGRCVATGSEDASVRLWDVATGQALGEALVHRGPVRSLAFSPDGQMLLTGTWDDGAARLWDVSSRQPLGPPMPHQEHVLAVAFSPDGRTIATGAWNGNARLWDVATRKPLGPRLEHGRTVRDVAFSPDGTRLLTASFDRTVRCWEIPQAADGSVERLMLWIQSLTGMELDEDGLFRELDAVDWAKRRAKLRSLGAAGP